jgi:uncharacterized protein YllA (UPF0747 family)
MYINFSDIPDHNNLFLDYLYEFENVKEFFNYNFRDQDHYQENFKRITESDRINPSLLKKNLLSQYSGLTTSNKTKKNIELLAKNNTLAVVTGQQLGLLGGPMYTFYKIITTLKLSKRLNDKFDNYNFVPVFWMEGDDHDFNEVRSINVIGTENTIKNIGYKEHIDPDDAKKSVGALVLDDALDEFFNNLDDRVKELLKPIFKKEIVDFREHTEKLVNISARLEEVYHAQVKVKPVNLFYSTDDGRYSIEPVENEFRLKRKRISFTQEELLEKVDKEPERFSPNVLLRPICQDFLLPTTFYVGGPSEISYFAQVTQLYEFYKLHTPIIYPRSSATLLESNISKTLEKYNISFNDIFMGVDELKKKVVDSLTENNVDEVFSETEKDVELAIDRLQERLYDVDKTIADNSNKYRSKIFNSLNELKNKAEQAQNQKFEVTLRQMERASTMLFPANNLQERVLNYTYFANKYGDRFLKRLYDDLNTDKFEHQVIEL